MAGAGSRPCLCSLSVDAKRFPACGCSLARRSIERESVRTLGWAIAGFSVSRVFFIRVGELVAYCRARYEFRCGNSKVRQDEDVLDSRPPGAVACTGAR
eukprot:594328-Prorocentrum_minimum.AAC.1